MSGTDWEQQKSNKPSPLATHTKKEKNIWVYWVRACYNSSLAKQKLDSWQGHGLWGDTLKPETLPQILGGPLEGGEEEDGMQFK